MPAILSQEAHFLCGTLNSIAVRSFVAAYAVETQISTHTVKYVRIPKFDPDSAEHAVIVAASRAAHKAVAAGKDPDQEAVDVAAGRLWDLTEGEIAAMREFLDKLRKRDLAQE